MTEYVSPHLRELKQQSWVLAQELMKRRGEDPLRNFRPHKKQEDFIDAVFFSGISENWFCAANRAGKSDAGAFVGSRFARFGMPGEAKFVGGKGSRFAIADRATSGWVVGVDFPSSRDVIQPKYFDNGFVPPTSTHRPFIPEHEIADWRATDQILKLKNGSIIGFKSCDSGPSKFQGSEKQWIHFDEEPDHTVYKEASIRISGTPLVIFGTCTILPETGRSSGISWLYKEIIDPWKKGSRKIGVFQASIYDNPHLSQEAIRELEDKYPEGSIERRIRLDGELLPGLLGSRAYMAFNHILHVRPQPLINPRRPLCWALDFNVSPMASLLIQRERELVRIYKEITVDGEGLPGVADAFHEAIPSHQAEIWIYGDSTGKKRSGQTGKSDYYVLMNNLKQHDYQFVMKVPEENPRVPDRINAMNQKLKSTEGHVEVEIDPSCEDLIADLEMVVRDNRQGIKKVTDAQNPYFRRTHWSDALGYYIAYEFPVKVKSLGSTNNPNTRKVTIRDPSYSRR